MSEIDYAERLLAIAMKSKENFRDIQNSVSGEMFLNVSQCHIWVSLEGYFEEYGALPTQDILAEVLNGKDGQDTLAWSGILSKVNASLTPEDEQHLGYYADRLERDYRIHQVKSNIQGSIAELKRQDVDAAVDALYKEWPKPKNMYVSREFVGDIDAAYSRIEDQVKNPKKYEGVRFGFPTMDNSTGGLCRGELAVMVGGAGIGKSLFIGACAINASLRGTSVLLVTVENSVEAYMNRLYSNFTGIPYYRFKQASLTDVEKQRWLREVGNLPEDFTLDIAEFCDGCSVRDIHNYMRHSKHNYGFLCVDQVTNMLPNNPKDFTTGSHLWFSDIAWGLKRLAGSAYGGKGIPILTAAHAAAGTVGKKEFTVEDIGMSKAILRHAHAGLFLTKDEDGHLALGASKYRDAKVETIPVFADYGCWRLSENSNTGESIPDAPTTQYPSGIEVQHKSDGMDHIPD